MPRGAWRGRGRAVGDGCWEGVETRDLTVRRRPSRRPVRSVRDGDGEGNAVARGLRRNAGDGDARDGARVGAAIEARDAGRQERRRTGARAPGRTSCDPPRAPRRRRPVRRPCTASGAGRVLAPADAVEVFAEAISTRRQAGLGGVEREAAGAVVAVACELVARAGPVEASRKRRRSPRRAPAALHRLCRGGRTPRRFWKVSRQELHVAVGVRDVGGERGALAAGGRAAERARAVAARAATGGRGVAEHAVGGVGGDTEDVARRVLRGSHQRGEQEREEHGGAGVVSHSAKVPEASDGHKPRSA